MTHLFRQITRCDIQNPCETLVEINMFKFKTKKRFIDLPFKNMLILLQTGGGGGSGLTTSKATGRGSVGSTGTASGTNTETTEGFSNMNFLPNSRLISNNNS